MSEHFTMAEFLQSDTANNRHIVNMLTWDAASNLVKVADTMEKVRALLGNLPVTISSGYRCPELNAAVGGVSDSAHVQGLACDFTVPSYGTPLDICRFLEPHLKDLSIDQLIYEHASWVHLGLSAGAPRNMALTIDDSGTRYGFA